MNEFPKSEGIKKYYSECWEPKVDLEEGLRRYIEWYKAEINMRKKE